MLWEQCFSLEDPDTHHKAEGSCLINGHININLYIPLGADTFPSNPFSVALVIICVVYDPPPQEKQLFITYTNPTVPHARKFVVIIMESSVYSNREVKGFLNNVSSLKNREVHGTTLSGISVFEMVLKTLLTLWRLNFFFFYFDVCVVWWCSGGLIMSQEYKRFEIIYAVTIKISMTEYHHCINRLTYGLF